MTTSRQQDNFTILLSGAPGTGKSTIQRLAPTFFRTHIGMSAAFGADEIYGIVDPDWSQNSENLRNLCKSNCIQLALNLFRHGVRVVLIAGNALFDWRDVSDYVEAFKPVSSVYHFTLTAPVEEVYTRVKQRGDADAHPQAWLNDWLKHVERHAGAWTHIVDTSQYTPTGVLELILSRIEDRAGTLR